MGGVMSTISNWAVRMKPVWPFNQTLPSQGAGYVRLAPPYFIPPLQVISGEAVAESLTGVDMPVAFGSSLASSLDVDDNGYNGKARI